MFLFLVILVVVVGLSVAAFISIARKVARMDIKKANLKVGDLNTFQRFVRKLVFLVEDMTPSEKEQYEKEQEALKLKLHREQQHRDAMNIAGAIYVSRPSGTDRF